MDMTGERRIPAPKQRVWTALNDPEVLRGCIPGCQTLEKTSDTDMTAAAARPRSTAANSARRRPLALADPRVDLAYIRGFAEAPTRPPVPGC